MTDQTTLPPEDDAETAGSLPQIPAPPPAAPVAKSKQAAKSKQTVQKQVSAGEIITAAQTERVNIVLEENDNIPPTGLFIGINGRSYQLVAGEEVSVPVEVLNVLDDAVEDVPRVDGNRNVVDYRRKMRFPYRIIR